jgi:hypothetical protein
MKRISTLLAILFAATGVFAQTAENFNSRTGATLTQVKSLLQSNCWQFTDFDINNGGWNPGIEGNGAMVSGLGNSSSENTGIYTQSLALMGNTQFSFKYAFNGNVTDRRWLNIYLTDGSNNILYKLDSVELTGAQAGNVYSYNKNFSDGGSGCYRIYINYQGVGGAERIAIDQLTVNAAPCYNSGCPQPPVAVNDFVAGTNNYTASGNVLPNDSDPQNSTLNAHLVTNSPDGNVVLNSFGTFTFTPNPGFTGTSTSFTYMVCNSTNPPLCSNVATVLITFSAQGSLPVSIVDLSATYNNGIVLVKWTTTFEINNDHFEIERSTDGTNYKTVGTVKGQGTSSISNNYQYSDEVRQNTINKNDLYYRLKQVDLDGKATYSKVLIVRVYQTRALQSVSVTPNPTYNDIKVSLQLNENSYIVTKVTSSNGTELMRKASRANAGSNYFTMEGTSRLQPGIYFLEVIVNSNERMMVKLIKN